LDREFPRLRAWIRLQFAEALEKQAKLPGRPYGVEGRAALEERRMLNLAFDYARTALRLEPRNSRIFIKIVYLGAELHAPLDTDIRALIETSVASGVRPPPDLIHAAYSWEWHGFLQELGLLGAVPDPSADPIAATKIAYRRVADAARKSGAVFFAMQYPTGRPDVLKGIFAEPPVPLGPTLCGSLYRYAPEIEPAGVYRDIGFISNANFLTFAMGREYENYFIDRFARACGAEFGHTTARGHEVIAINAADAIQANWERIDKRPRSSAFLSLPSSPRGKRGIQHN
jgi:hypothetical protein